MGCTSCKEQKTINVNGEVVEEKIKTNLIFRLILFLIAVAILPLLLPMMIVVLFNHLVLNNGFSFNWMITLFKKRNKRSKAEKIENMNPDDYELVGVVDSNRHE